MKTACILHNLMLTVDGMDKFNWESLSPENEDEEEGEEDVEDDNLDAIVSKKLQPPVVTPTTLHGATLNPKEPQHYSLLKKLLVTNFVRQYQIGDLHWPRKMSNDSRTGLPKTPPPVARLEEARVTIQPLPGNQLKSLYTKNSDLRRKALDGEYRLPIGRGLFSSMFLKKNANLGQFNGEIIDQSTFDSREEAGLGGYCIALGSGNYLDCYPAVQQGQCMLSLANDARQCFNISTGKTAINNCEFRISQSTASLVTSRNVLPNTELCVNYGNGYELPALLYSTSFNKCTKSVFYLLFEITYYGYYIDTRPISVQKVIFFSYLQSLIVLYSSLIRRSMSSEVSTSAAAAVTLTLEEAELVVVVAAAFANSARRSNARVFRALSK
jgi:Na+-transporting methylmalonyl-CoA/oxaloacetate decarboxylase gamma subunit